MGGRGADSGIPTAVPGGGGGGGRGGKMDAFAGSPDTAQEALGKKGRPMATRDAVMNANPFFDKSYTTAEYNMNCQRCVAALEARFRGYDVIAQATYDGDKMPRGNNYASNWENPQIIHIGKSRAASTQAAVEAQMKQWGDGSRAVLSVDWKGSRSGHVLNIVQRAGKTHYYDGQSGSILDPKALFKAAAPSKTDIMRVDNLAFSSTVNDAVRTTPKRNK